MMNKLTLSFAAGSLFFMILVGGDMPKNKEVVPDIKPLDYGYYEIDIYNNDYHKLLNKQEYVEYKIAKAEEKARIKAAEEEARKKAEEEAKKKAEEEAKKKAEEEAKKKAEEEAKKKAELKAKAEKEAKAKAEEEAKAQMAFAANQGKANIQQKDFEYLSSETNRQSVLRAVMNLNYGTSQNTCVYFQAEALRRVGYNVPVWMHQTSSFMDWLEQQGWVKDYNYKNVQPGDICFTTDNGNAGTPTHCYMFMSLVSPNNYDSAWIVDNQIIDYGKTYHIRNFVEIGWQNGKEKDELQFFYHLPR